MKQRYDAVIRGGTIADGTGGPLQEGDVAIENGKIACVGHFEGEGREEIDARGLLVTPGFVDLHTHYDGQATWDSRLAPSSWHGVTTAVMGNCGVGFAPVKPSDRDRLLELMEGVEDIPGPVLREGLNWRWETFADYLGTLDSVERDIDVCTQLAHGPMRIFVMGERAMTREDATAEEIATMQRMTADAMRQGAIGFSTSRTINHKSARGENTPSYRAREEELLGIAAGMKQAGRGVIQFISDWNDPGLESEFNLVRRLVQESGRSLSFSLGQMHANPEQWRQLLTLADDAARNGLDVRAQVAPRSIAVLLGLQGSIAFFTGFPSYDAVAHLPLAEKLAIMRTPEFKNRLLAERQQEPDSPIAQRLRSLDGIFMLGDPPVYEPSPESSVAAIAARTQRTPLAVAYEHLVTGTGENLFFAPINNYANANLDACREMIAHPRSLLGLGDGGAHVSIISDASFSTYMLTHWGRDRVQGRFPIEWLVKRLTNDGADFIGLSDRGQIKPGQKADINLIDFEALSIDAPYMACDLPCGGKRLLQKAAGYRRTLVNGVSTYINGEQTGALPGRVVRST